MTEKLFTGMLNYNQKKKKKKSGKVIVKYAVVQTLRTFKGIILANTTNVNRSMQEKTTFEIFPMSACIFLTFVVIMPPTLKKLMGHIAFGACVGGCVGGSHFLYLL